MSPAGERSSARGSWIVDAACGIDQSFWVVKPPLPEEAAREEDLSTEYPSAGSPSRFPSSHGDPRRSAHCAFPPSTGSCPAIGLIWRIRDRTTFVELARRGRRVSKGPLTVVYLDETGESPVISRDSSSTSLHPRVAFAVPRAVGSAVERNRVRRRIRAIVTDMATSEQMTTGAWLFIVRPGAQALEFSELDIVVRQAVQALGSRQVA